MTGNTPSSIHPPLPPTTEEDRFSWLRLLRCRRVGISTFHRLLAEHGTAQNALMALPEVARAAGMDAYEICPPGVIEAELRAARAAKARLLCLGEPDYPRQLAEISDAPPMLWAVGDPSLAQRPVLAIVGARNASSLGMRMARALARDLAEAGFVIVSGLARGIDTAAHGATVQTGTIAVQAGGVDVMYPAENTSLAHDIGKDGLRLSEQPMGLAPMARHFPCRNRLISGLARAVIVVEAATRSGSLITAQGALDQGRDVLAVPGHPFDARAGGCNALIRDGARLIRSADDVIEAAGAAGAPEMQPSLPGVPEPEAQPPRPSSGTGDRRSRQETMALHQKILSRLGPSPIAEDSVIRDLGLSAQTVSPALVDLELDGQVQRHSGGLLSRVTTAPA